MWKDEIVEEVRKVRDEYAAKFNYDLDAIYEDIKKQEKQSRRKVVFLPPKKVDSAKVINDYWGNASIDEIHNRITDWKNKR